mmetsp:Transcript_33407/g.38363  ORF Transcript_33407/g.38363 Transcript_33407/m.38363 type:complete len:131 (+) Transcript_33407:728-1120(+)
MILIIVFSIVGFCLLFALTGLMIFLRIRRQRMYMATLAMNSNAQAAVNVAQPSPYNQYAGYLNQPRPDATMMQMNQGMVYQGTRIDTSAPMQNYSPQPVMYMPAQPVMIQPGVPSYPAAKPEASHFSVEA